VVTTAQRLQALPDIPSSAEAGITNTNLYSWWTVHTPKGTPQPIRDRIETIFNEIAVEPDTKQFLANNGSDPFPGNHDVARHEIEQGIKDWGAYVKLAKIEPLS